MKHIFDIWPSLKEMASDLRRPYPTVAAWHARKSIPAKYDADLVRCAKARGQIVTFEELAHLRAQNDEGAAA